MASKIFICVLLFAVLGCSLAKLHKTGKGKGSYGKVKKGYKTKPIPEEPVAPRAPVSPCEGVFCGAGRVCMVTDQEPSCQCAEICEAHEHPVCGSNGVTYPNKCELHRAACILQTKITQLKAGICKVAPTVAQITRSPPVVCYQTDRNVLQKQLVQWIQGKEMADGWFQKGKKYLDVVDDYFQTFDESRDALLDTTEFMRFVEHNETVRNSTSLDENTEGDNQLMRSMCVDALVAEADQDFDWRLNKQEFESCLSPEFVPGTRMCSLESREYPDGEVVPNRCNECVCACGNWVCTANACDGDIVAGTEAQEEYDPIQEENAMNEREWSAIMKKLAKINPVQFPEHVRDLKHLNEKIKAVPEAPQFMDEFLGEEEEGFDQIMEEEEETEFEEEIVKMVALKQAAPVAPVMIDEVPLPVEVDIPEQPHIVDERPREGKRGGRGDRKHKGDRHRGGKKTHKRGGIKN